MALVAMTCPNCNGPMEPEKSYFKCTHCQTIMLNIIDAKIDEDVTVMTPDEFAKKLEESKRSFVINLNDNLQEFDVDTLVTNKKIKDAYALLNEGKFDKVHDALNGVGNRILSAERLRYLASYKVHDEYELSYIDGYVDGYNYKNLISLCDEETKKTYQKIESYTRERHDTKVAIEKEIKEVNKLFEVQLYEEAIAYTKEMCRKYPQTALSWSYACEAKARAGRSDCNDEFKIMKKCPDYSYHTVSYNIGECLREMKEANENDEGTFGGLCGFGVLLLILALSVSLLTIGITSPFDIPSWINWIFMVLGILGAIGCGVSLYQTFDGGMQLFSTNKKAVVLKKWEKVLPGMAVILKDNYFVKKSYILRAIVLVTLGIVAVICAIIFFANMIGTM